MNRFVRQALHILGVEADDDTKRERLEHKQETDKLTHREELELERIEQSQKLT